MTYKFDETLLNGPKLRVIQTAFTVGNMEQDESNLLSQRDYFIRNWHVWTGFKTTYHFTDTCQNIIGSRGKTIWYIPALDAVSSHILQIPIGQALKIVQYMVKDNMMNEYERLKNELEIQNKLATVGYGPFAYEIVVVKNLNVNSVIWFDHIYEHKANSLYLTTK